MTMKNTGKIILTMITSTILLTACGGGGSGANTGSGKDGNTPPPQTHEPKFQAMEVSLAEILPGNVGSTRHPNLYTEKLGKKDNVNVYLLNGLVNPTAPKAWSIYNAPIANILIPNSHTIDYQQGRARLMYNDYNHHEDHGRILSANDLKFTESAISAAWQAATIEDIDEGANTTAFYALNDYAVAGWDLGNETKELLFVKFASLESYPTPSREYSEGFRSSSCARTEDDSIFSIATPLNHGGVTDNNYVAVGTMQGGLCIYGAHNAKNPGWINLTPLAINSGYKTKEEIVKVQFVNFEGNHYIYWGITDGTIWRGIIDSKGQRQPTFVNLQDTRIYKNIPKDVSSAFNPLFVDAENNLYLGRSGNDNLNTPSKIYVLPTKSFTWQEIVLPKNFDTLKHISLAMDGVTVVAGTTDAYGKDRAYYLYSK